MQEVRRDESDQRGQEEILERNSDERARDVDEPVRQQRRDAQEQQVVEQVPLVLCDLRHKVRVKTKMGKSPTKQTTRKKEETHFLLEAADHAGQHSTEDAAAQEVGQHEAQRRARGGAESHQQLGLQKWVHGPRQDAQNDGPRDGEGLQRDVHEAEAAEHEGRVVLAVLAGALPQALHGAHFVVAPVEPRGQHAADHVGHGNGRALGTIFDSIFDSIFDGVLDTQSGVGDAFPTHVQLGLGRRLEEQVHARHGAQHQQRQQQHVHARRRLHGDDF
ncbi:unnamed protein product [Phytophthora lilii]|uniref:Unnamed protein product n=1 Tax=Phytophthora lilii TaxID=2077276 RepID=A0A9W6X5G9_9STRA|nr:unnamed protein product [Phytophthora lilii]